MNVDAMAFVFATMDIDIEMMINKTAFIEATQPLFAILIYPLGILSALMSVLSTVMCMTSALIAAMLAHAFTRSLATMPLVVIVVSTFAVLGPDAFSSAKLKHA